MNTHNLFVELVVIGVGALGWVAVTVVRFFGTAVFPLEDLFSPLVAIPLLSLVYLLGILTDRAADWITDRFPGPPLAKIGYGSDEDFFCDRRLILTKAERFASNLRYDRSRLRICRGWAFNAFLLSISLGLYIASDLVGKNISISATVFFLLLSGACLLAWRSLRNKEYKKVKRIAKWLREAEENATT